MKTNTGRWFGRIGIIAKTGDERVGRTLTELIPYLLGQSMSVFLDEDGASMVRGAGHGVKCRRREEMGDSCDLVIVLGGDGTFLGAARALGDSDARVLGINLGRLGFLVDIMPSEMKDRLDAVFRGDFVEERRYLMNAGVVREGEPLFGTAVLNDVVVHKGHIARLIAFETFIDGHRVYSQRADGLIVSTPTGSTAYALSGGGPILHPNLDAIVLVPICPHSLNNRPMVVEGKSLVEIAMERGERTEASVTCDGQTTWDLLPGDRIVVSRRDQSLHLIHPAGYDYYDTLRAKLNWDYRAN